MKREEDDNWTLLMQKEQDDEVYTILFNRHKDYIFRLACRFSGDQVLADEITQEVFIRIFNGRRKWQPLAKFSTWLYRITLNTSREIVRKRKRELFRQSTLLETVAEDRETNKDEIIEEQLHRLLAALPERQREALVLRFFEKLSIKETAQIMGCRIGTIKSHLHKALKNLRTIMMQEEVER